MGAKRQRGVWTRSTSGRRRCRLVYWASLPASLMMPGVVHAATQAAASPAPSAPLPAQADTAQAAAGGDSPAGQSGLGDVVVTARRVSERLQDIPASVAAVSSEQVARMSSLDDIQSLVSGVTFKNVGVAVTVSIRGYGNRPVLTGANQTVGIFQDGVFVAPFLNALDTRTDVSRIEVAKGPQSTLYGRSTYAGAINIVTNDPTKTLTGYVEGGLGGSSADGELLWHAQGVVSGPITNTLSARVFVLREKRDGFSYDPVTNFRGNGYDRTVGRIKLLWEPTDDLTVRLSGTLMHDNAPRGETHSGLVTPPLGNLALFGDPAMPPSFVTGPDIWRGSFAREPVGKVNGQEGTLDLRYRTPIGELALLSDYTHSDTNVRNGGSTGTAQDIVDVFTITDEQRFSQEVRLSNKVGRFNYLAGLYYLYTDFKIGNPGATIDLNSPSAVFHADSTLYDAPPNVAATYAPGYTKTHAYSGFAQIGFDLTDRLNLTAGLREGRDALRGSTSNTLLTRTGALITTTPITPQKATFNATTGSANISYKINTDVLAYGSYSRGNSPGGFNTGGAALIDYAPQNVDAFELGIKSTILDRHLRLNVALFDNQYSQLQFFQAITFNGIITQVQAQRRQGAGPGYRPRRGRRAHQQPSAWYPVHLFGLEDHAIQRAAAPCPAGQLCGRAAGPLAQEQRQRVDHLFA